MRKNSQAQANIYYKHNGYLCFTVNSIMFFFLVWENQLELNHFIILILFSLSAALFGFFDKLSCSLKL